MSWTGVKSYLKYVAYAADDEPHDIREGIPGIPKCLAPADWGGGCGCSHAHWRNIAILQGVAVAERLQIVIVLHHFETLNFVILFMLTAKTWSHWVFFVIS